MNAVQLEFQVDDTTEIEIKISYMQKQIDEDRKSADKVRKKLFSQMGELSKLCMQLQNENIELKQLIQKTTNEKTCWVYGKEDCLFDVQKYPINEC